ncbi:MAG: hypothetical protein NVSMB24_40310 [Mucilaginibacter sp.]
MFINISDSKEAANKGSSSGLVYYLEKENRFAKKNEPEFWFNGRQVNIDPYQVMRTIDNNIAKLGKVDAKFFLVNISPSQKEIAFLREQYGDDGVRDQLKGFAVRVVDAYAQNFKRAGINSHEDLVWFAKLENHRYYSYNDPEVKQGLKKRGDQKEGEQMHIQVIVSRKDATNTIKLSPMNTSRGKNEEHSKKMGQFDRVAFKQCGEMLFDSLFEFDRQLRESMAYANVQKNGGLDERMKMDSLVLDISRPDEQVPQEDIVYHDVYFGETDHPIPWQTDHLNCWRTDAANAVEAFTKIVITFKRYFIDRCFQVQVVVFFS